ncbi:MAG: hypothetical protein IH850_12645 [Acidobacteria bacterium]|nr:hypothetical protein [Acidobacteriota bacterium]
MPEDAVEELKNHDPVDDESLPDPDAPGGARLLSEILATPRSHLRSLGGKRLALVTGIAFVVLAAMAAALLFATS